MKLRPTFLASIALMLALLGCGPGGPLLDASPHARTPRAALMMAIPRGAVTIGDNSGPPDEGPAFVYDARAFLLDRTPVTVAQYSAFVADTHYRTRAERDGGSNVFDHRFGGWRWVKGATWRNPFGPRAAAAPADHPVTQVSWRDADAFCRAYGLRLPTEFEWERAALLGQTPDGHVFRAGDSRAIDARREINAWDGVFPLNDAGADGYRGPSPVGAFGETPAGLTDMAGNVWEWTHSWRRPYATRDRPFTPRPTDERVQRGGSFLCDAGACDGFRVSARGHAPPDSAFVHVGFRCAADPRAFSALAGGLRAPGAGAHATLAVDRMLTPRLSTHRH